MKKKLIACAIISSVSFLLFIFLMFAALLAARHADDNLNTGETTTIRLISFMLLGCWIANIVMGIIVLSTGKFGNQSNRLNKFLFLDMYRSFITSNNR